MMSCVLQSLRTVICALLACILSCGTPVCAEQNLNFTDDSWINARYDWAIYLNPKSLPNFLNYPTSNLNPAVNVSVSYRVASRFHPRSLQQVHYEDLWYHGAQPIGCRMFSKLEIGPGWQGAIVIPPSSDANSNPGALANAIVRLLLDVNLKKCNLVVVFADPQVERQICDQLGQFKFFRTDDDSIASAGTLRFFVSSGDIRDRIFLVYEPRNSLR
jgi:hypothetical protein